MAAIEYVVNGITVEDQSHFNQYADALLATLGISDDDQDALGRLVLPSGTSFPGSPSDHQVFVLSDQGPGDGRLYKYHASIGRWIPYFGTQVQKSNEVDLQTTSDSFVDDGETVSIQTWGGRLEIKLVANGSAGYVQAENLTNDGLVEVRVSVGAVNLNPVQVGLGISQVDLSTAAKYPPGGFVWDYTPPTPDTYIVKVSARALTSGDRITINDCCLLVTEHAV